MNPELKHNEAQYRYELHLDGQLAGHADYRRHGGVVEFTHTETNKAFEGQGVGSKVAAFALDDVRRSGLKADPRCPFIARFIEKNPQYADLVHKRS